MFNLNVNRKIKNKIKYFLIVMSLGLGVMFGFQNCSNYSKKYSMNQLDSSSKAKIFNVLVEEHPIEVKLLSASYELQLSDRNYVAGVLMDVFGPNSSEIINNNILLKYDELGGPCSENANFAVKTILKDRNPKLYDANRVCSEENTIKPLVPSPQTLRQGLIIQSCSQLVGKTDIPKTLEYSLGKIQVGATLSNLPLANSNNIINLHRLFYRERPLPSEAIIDSIKMMISSNKPTVEEWKTAIYSYCISSQWQVL